MNKLRLVPDFDLRPYNTLGVPARSRFGVVLDDPAVLPELFAVAAGRALPVRVLGGGSNVVLSPDYYGVTVLVATRGRSVVAAGPAGTLVEAAAGENWHGLVEWTIGQGLGGLENLAGIPGTVGAAPIQNIGAYGVELADRFDSLVAFDTASHQMRRFEKEQCRFAYRDSVFKHERGRYVVVSVRVRLPQPWAPVLTYPGLSGLDPAAGADARAVMEAVLRLRGSKLPDWRVTPNVGSFFHNPIVTSEAAASLAAANPGAPAWPLADGKAKLSAAWLIERAGLKGFRMGPVGVSDKHALVLVNYGGGTADDLLALADRIKQEVRTRFGVRLVEEPQFI
ncbi:UDP-N-acetylmuramate dehydrogenase [Devosia sp.]|uniref:UDP-N-acetylmuramate dehydrogenase n=1 Tax=Devosia sp. TaxID=1871048 RepID=UPI002EF1B58B